MRLGGGARVLLALTALGLACLTSQADSSAAPNSQLESEDVVVSWMSGVTYNARACVGVGDGDGLHGDNAYDLIADDEAPPCWDHGVPADVYLRTLGYSSTAHVTLHGTISTGHYTDGCDYIEVRTTQNPSGEYRGTYRYVHALGTPGQQVDILAGPGGVPTGMDPPTPIGSTSHDSDCQGGWTGYHTHQDSGGLTDPQSVPNAQPWGPGLPTDDDVPLWDPSSWIHKWTYPAPAPVPPPPPAAVTLSGSNGTGTVSWNSVAGATSYSVYVGRWNNGSYIPVVNWAQDSSSPYNFPYTVSDDYYASVKACNAGGCSAARDSSPYWVALGPRFTSVFFFGPAPAIVSNTTGRYMWIISLLRNPDAASVEVELRPDVTGAPAGCSQIEQLILPGTEQFWLTAGEEKWILYRFRYECHSPAHSGVWPLAAQMCVRYASQGVDLGCRGQTRQFIVS